jgi:hypothetical protein
MASPRKPNQQPADEQPITGVDFTEVRTGEDTRQRGWFWHWNELHTEYEPLLKHSGIGLITSYIVWTDRREHSPYRGYAFPSLQSQAAFSGSDRAELITINRILVALDLLEIRKEMVLRIDEKGHKWRVPHNLYRVKDRSGDPHLTTADVTRVLELAAERKDVYRHIRHILTSSFVPISRNNVWHQILAELRPTALWQRLAEQALAEEARFSARSKAGHRSRKSAEDAGAESSDAPTKKRLRTVDDADLDADFFVPGSEDADSPATVVSDQSQSRSDERPESSVAATNDGCQTSVAASNQGLEEDGPSSGGPSNQGRATSVAPSNPMYDQSLQTTRTNTGDRGQRTEMAVTSLETPVTGVVTSTGVALSQVGAGPGNELAPVNGPDRAAALVAFAEANGRTASAAEERLLGQIAADAGAAQGWAIVTAAIYEAVDSGSAFVAPKRVREIVRRWLRDGLPAELAGSDERGSTPIENQAPVEAIARDEVATDEVKPFWVAEAGIGSAQLWAAVIDLIAQQGAARPAEIHDYLKPAILVERIGPAALRLGVPHELARQRIERRWRAALEDALAQLLGGSQWELDIQVIGEAARKSA